MCACLYGICSCSAVSRAHRCWFAAAGLLAETIRAVHTQEGFLPAAKHLNSHACTSHACTAMHVQAHVKAYVSALYHISSAMQHSTPYTDASRQHKLGLSKLLG
eukprot:365593-Chlamydomonas_euryale.AAC.3